MCEFTFQELLFFLVGKGPSLVLIYFIFKTDFLHQNHDLLVNSL